MSRTLVSLCAAIVAVVACGDGATSTGGCDLTCDVGTSAYSLDITCESGGVTKEFMGETTTYTYDNGTRTGFTLALNQQWTFQESGSVYDITGTIVVNEVQDVVSSYNIQVSGGAFGTTPKSCHS